MRIRRRIRERGQGHRALYGEQLDTQLNYSTQVCSAASLVWGYEWLLLVDNRRYTGATFVTKLVARQSFHLITELIFADSAKMSDRTLCFLLCYVVTAGC